MQFCNYLWTLTNIHVVHELYTKTGEQEFYTKHLQNKL